MHSSCISPGNQSVFRPLPLAPDQACHWPLADCSAGNKRQPWPIPALLPRLPWKQGWWRSRWSSRKPSWPEEDPVHLSSVEGKRNWTWANPIRSVYRSWKVTSFASAAWLFLLHQQDLTTGPRSRSRVGHRRIKSYEVLWNVTPYTLLCPFTSSSSCRPLNIFNCPMQRVCGFYPSVFFM